MSDSSDDDRPLAVSKGPHASTPSISAAATGISIRNGLVQNNHYVKSTNGIDGKTGSNGTNSVSTGNPSTNGAAKRKSRDAMDKPKISYEDDSSSDDDAPMAKRQKSEYVIGNDQAKKATDTSGIKRIRKKEESDSEDEVLSKLKKRQSNGVALSSHRSNGVHAIKNESDSDTPMAKKKTPISKTGSKSSVRPIAKPSSKPSKPNNTPKAVASSNQRKTPTSKAATKKAESTEPGDAEDEEEEEYRWWDQPKKEDDTIKWTTLEHAGVVFPPAYQPLPKHVHLYYDGIPVNLHPDAEEVATFFGSMLHLTVNTENPTFQKNFFADFKEVLDNTGGATGPGGQKVPIKEFAKLDFRPMFEHFKAQSEAKKARSKEEKKAEKEEKAKLEAPYLYCKWDGRKEKVGNFRVEPPGLFRGRGEHPKTGRVKKRVLPEQVTINIGKDAVVPKPPPGHKWKAVQHDNKATWLAMWQENINGCYKYVMLAANSAIKGQADFKKFEKARDLKKHIARIRADYTRELKSEVMADRQRATAMYLIDRFALRAGNEKDTDNEADTVGCCSLKYEHITLKEPSTVIFDFLGKDSIPFYDEVVVERQVFKNLKLFKKPPKTDGDDIFDRLSTSQLNKHLSSYMQGLTAKVFRTYNASYTMSKLLQELPVTNLTIAEKVKLYNDCNRKVAILCNHKRTVTASHEAQMGKLGDRIKGLKYQKWRTKMMMLDIDPKQKKKRGAEYFELDSELTDEWIVEHHVFLAEELRTKITKKFEKDNEKRASEGEKSLPEKELKERLKAVTELEAKLKKEHRTKKADAEGKAPSIERLEAAVQKIDERVHNMEMQAADKDGNKEVALSTSKINYIDPRLTVVFSKKFDVPIEKFFSKTLREKFNWAIHSVGDDSTWEF